MTGAAASLSPKRPGRPRRVTLEAVVEAACEFGVDRIEMGPVADRLGVGVGTLYRLVRDRDHLVQLVAARRSRTAKVVDHGQSWQDALRERAASSFRVFTTSPDLIGHVMTASISDDEDPLMTEAVLRLLVDRGFNPVDALNLYQSVQQIVAGAVVGHGFKRAIEARFGSYGGLVRHVDGALGSDRIPLLRAAIEAGGDPPGMDDYRPGLELVLADYERRIASGEIVARV